MNTSIIKSRINTKMITNLTLLVTLLINAACVEAKSTYDFVVSKGGDDDFTTVQAAIDAVPHLRKTRTTIFIKNGLYKERLILPSTKVKVSLIGESKDSCIITSDNYASKLNRFGEEMGTSGSSGFYIFGNDFLAENITFENSSGEVGQAVAVRVDGDKIVFKNCRFLGNQDTLYPHGKESRQYYKDCYIEGTVDFIFGWSTAVFDNCHIHGKRGGYLTAASTEENTKYGFVFLNCKITADAPEGSIYLGRPWRPYAQTVFINCSMDKSISPKGWHNWNKKEAEQTTLYAEYNSTGTGGKPDARVEWSHQLTKEEANTYTIETIFGDWNPNK